jgi:hypothetical protein
MDVPPTAAVPVDVEASVLIDGAAQIAGVLLS